MSYPHSRQEEGRKEREELAVALSGEQRLSPKSLADFHLVRTVPKLPKVSGKMDIIK